MPEPEPPQRRCGGSNYFINLCYDSLQMPTKIPKTAEIKPNTVWDVVVIGGGPAGMMAAGRAGERGLKVLLLEKNNSLGKKLRITGGGRCNVTNAEEDTREFISNYKEAGKFLFSPFSIFNQKDTLNFFHSRGMPTKVEDRKRVFPQSDSAESVWNVFIEYLKKGGVEVMLNAEVKKFETKNNSIKKVVLKTGEEILAKSFVLATGGKGRPETGSTGDGFLWLKDMGHSVEEPVASLVPLIVKENFIKHLQGITLPEVKISVYQNGIKQQIQKKETSAVKKTGRLLFTHFGLSGPMILNMSKAIGELLPYGNVNLLIDAVPHIPNDVLNTELQEIFKKEGAKKIKNCLSKFAVLGFIEEILKIAEIDENIVAHNITREMRVRLINTLKAFPLTVTGLLGEDKAIVTSGGVALTEVDFKTFKSKIINNLFLVGDILNIDRPSGGFSLQLCWTSGYIAGNNV